MKYVIGPASRADDAGISGLASVPSTDLKNRTAEVYNRLNEAGALTVTRHDKPSAVLLSVSEYERLLSERRKPLEELEGEFEDLLKKMQPAKSRRAARDAFSAGTDELGKAAMKVPR